VTRIGVTAATDSLFLMISMILLGGLIALIVVERTLRPVARLRAWLAEAARDDEEQRPVHLKPEDFTFEE
jgi:hypothetical protein